ncbi:acetyltransferase (GNAT) family protein [Sanguibacter keddieii DSM 10542]|uniref:Acetyltransferase (GNAT) family protein n=1 Tax=Sanguibacter keddieii (strain ATCC 51767 / DSM 10542 / NCFB 3025 / ST-74) TaxID=446469 RepID=D1BCS8_SANKS|nr:acetyltransferase (GNAT) family protein [Sanguibacter keddieii DSM 10542]
MATTYRSATEHDIEWMVELRAEVLRDDLERLGRYDPHRVRQRMRDGYLPASTRVVLEDDVEVGCVAVRIEDDARWLEHFYLAPDVQGRGIGGRVLRTVLAEEDPRPFRLNVLQGSPARRLYERHGFTVDSQDDVDVFMTRADRPSGR